MEISAVSLTPSKISRTGGAISRETGTWKRRGRRGGRERSARRGSGRHIYWWNTHLSDETESQRAINTRTRKWPHWESAYTVFDDVVQISGGPTQKRVQEKRFVTNKKWVLHHDAWWCIDTPYGLDEWCHNDEWKWNGFAEYVGNGAAVGSVPVLSHRRTHCGEKQGPSKAALVWSGVSVTYYMDYGKFTGITYPRKRKWRGVELICIVRSQFIFDGVWELSVQWHLFHTFLISELICNDKLYLTRAVNNEA